MYHASSDRSNHTWLFSQGRGQFYKTKMCRFHEAGACTRGFECVYAHSEQELQRLPDLHKSRLCLRFRYSGSCNDEDSCRFAHGMSDLRPRSKNCFSSGKLSEASVGTAGTARESCTPTAKQADLQKPPVQILGNFPQIMRTAYLHAQDLPKSQILGESSLESQQEARIEMEPVVEGDIDHEPALWSRQTTADVLFDRKSFSRQTTESPKSEEEKKVDWLCVKNTFLEWIFVDCSAAIRSKSAHGRIEAMT